MFAQVHAPKLVVIYIGSNDLSAAQCGSDDATLMAAVPGIVSRCAGALCCGAARRTPPDCPTGQLARS